MSLQGEIEGGFGQGIWVCGQWIVHGWIHECCEKVVENREEQIEGKVYGKEEGLPN